MRYQGLGDTADVQDSAWGPRVPALQQPAEHEGVQRTIAWGTCGAGSTAARSGTSAREPLRQGFMGPQQEDDMGDTTPALDEAFERMAAASFELPNGFVNHGAMACEALAVLDCTDDIDSWARRFARAGGASVDPVVPAGFEWRQALGDYRRLPEWIGYFTQAIDDDGWPAVVATWVPRLMPALRTALFHGAIRTAHAVRGH